MKTRSRQDFVEGELYFYNGIRHHHFHIDDKVIVKCITPYKNNKNIRSIGLFYGIVIFGNKKFKVGEKEYFDKYLFYKL